MIDGLVFECTPYLCRDNSIDNYNNIFGNTHAINQLIQQRGVDIHQPDLANNYFNSLGKHGGDFVDRIYVEYSFQSYSYWEYDPASQNYYRYQGNSFGPRRYIPLSDRYTDLPVSAENLIFLIVPHRFYYKSSSTEIVEIQLTGSGSATFSKTAKSTRPVGNVQKHTNPSPSSLPRESPSRSNPAVHFSRS